MNNIFELYLKIVNVIGLSISFKKQNKIIPKEEDILSKFSVFYYFWNSSLQDKIFFTNENKDNNVKQEYDDYNKNLIFEIFNFKNKNQIDISNNDQREQESELNLENNAVEHIDIRFITLAFYMRINYGTDFINNPEAMVFFHKKVDKFLKNSDSLLTGTLIVLVINDLIDGETIKNSFDNSLALVFEYYSQKKAFQTDLVNFEDINFPGIEDINFEDFDSENNPSSEFQKILWSTFKIDSKKELNEKFDEFYSIFQKNIIGIEIIIAIFYISNYNEIKENFPSEKFLKKIGNIDRLIESSEFFL